MLITVFRIGDHLITTTATRFHVSSNTFSIGYISNISFVIFDKSIILFLIWITNNLVLVSIMTGGGPIYHSMTLPLFIYKLGIQFGKLSQASAATMVNFVILLVFGLIYFAIFRRNQQRD